MCIVHGRSYRTGQEAARWDRVREMRSYMYKGPVRGWGIEERRQSDVSAYDRAKERIVTGYL